MSRSRNKNVQVSDDTLNHNSENDATLSDFTEKKAENVSLERNPLFGNKVSDLNADRVYFDCSSSLSSGEVTDVKIRDFAFSHTDPRHWGEQGGDTEIGSKGLSKAKALFDFEAENPSELSFMQDDILTIQHKQCAGWLVGFKVEDKVGLIPESFVRFIN